MLQPIPEAKAEVPIDVGADIVGIEDNCVEERCQDAREGGLSGAGQPHDQDFASHSIGPSTNKGSVLSHAADGSASGTSA
jgi:hypothetical protein